MTAGLILGGWTLALGACVAVLDIRNGRGRAWRAGTILLLMASFALIGAGLVRLAAW